MRLFGVVALANNAIVLQTLSRLASDNLFLRGFIPSWYTMMAMGLIAVVKPFFRSDKI